MRAAPVCADEWRRETRTTRQLPPPESTNRSTVQLSRRRIAQLRTSVSRVLRWLRLGFDYLRGMDLIAPGDNVVRYVVKPCNDIACRRAHRAARHGMAVLFAPLVTRRTCVAVICGMVRVINGKNRRCAFGGARCHSRRIALIEPDNGDQRQTTGNNRQPLEHGGRTSD